MRLKHTVHEAIKAIRSCTGLQGLLIPASLIDRSDDFGRRLRRNGGWESGARLLAAIHKPADVVDCRA